MEYLDGLLGLILGVLWTQHRFRAARKEARELHDSTLESSKELYSRTNQRLSWHIQGKQHD